ncbi:tetratricopeptide repeat protein [Williamsia sterculiae]|uniref:Putative thioredoxin n=1 Tax=Williamsia sterculiae TaxID=1344003 RepID=A0A1N7HFN1_9NOCA|nr:tetratricopeptide repeat protein [Williamsia sterculiae]SIS23687.1 putative thioredoxin [Williamsia sterculiae]
MSGAVDLSGLKERADAQRSRPAGPPGGGGRAPGGAVTGAQAADGSAAGGPGPSVPAVFDVDEASFESDVIGLSDQVVVVVDLWADWCQPCKQLSPVLEQLAEQAGGRWVLAKIDIEANPRIQQAFGVQSIPTVVAIAQGQPVSAFQGVQPAEQIQRWLDDVFAKVGDALPGVNIADAAPVEDPVDPRMHEAENRLNSGDLEGALVEYRALAEADPGNVEAASAARNVEFLLRATAHDPAVTETAAADDVDGQLAAADVLLLDQQPEAAFDRLIALIRTTSGDERTTVRTRLLSLFELFDPAEPFVISARRKLASALF